MSAIYAKRYEAVFLCTHASGPHLSYSADAKVLKKSKHFVQMGVEQYRDTKTVDDLPEKGETRVTSSKEDKMIVALFERNPTLRLREAIAKLPEKEIHVSSNTIRRGLVEAKVQYRPTRQNLLLSEVHMEKRLAWATENVDRDWSNVLSSDEASFWAWVPMKRAWSAASEHFLQRTAKHPIKIHVWGCFSQRGFGCLELFTENFNARKMLQIYEHGLRDLHRTCLEPTIRIGSFKRTTTPNIAVTSAHP